MSVFDRGPSQGTFEIDRTSNYGHSCSSSITRLEEYRPKDIALSGKSEVAKGHRRLQRNSGRRQSPPPFIASPYNGKKDPALADESKVDECRPPLKRNKDTNQVPCPSVSGLEDELKDLTLPDDGNIVKYPPSLDTDSTLSAHTAINQELMAKLESMVKILEAPEPPQTQGLTHLALQAHELSTKGLGYSRDLAGWCHDGDIFDRSDWDAELTDSMLVSKQSKNRDIKYTTSSNDILPNFGPIIDAEHGLNKAAVALRDIPCPSPRDDDEISTGLAEDSRTQRVAIETIDKESDQPVLTAQGYPVSLKHESLDPQDQGETVESPAHPWLTAVWYWLATVLDPPPEGAYRVTYTCGCGKLCYIDVEELVRGGAEELEQDIRKEAGSLQCLYPRSSHLPDDTIHAPAPVYSNSSDSSSISGQGGPAQYLPSLGEHSQSSITTEATTQGSASGISTTAQRYLLLCVNTKHGLVKLVNIDVSDCSNDQFLFQEIKNAYNIARQNHDWSLATLFPLRIRISRPIATIMSIVSLPNLRVSQWLADAFGDCKIFVPRKIEFVKFELMPVRLEIYAGNFEKPEIPGLEEVQVKKTYEYEPITTKAKILNVPIHELLKPGQHLNQYWWKRFPKKLDNPLDFNEGLDCYGWGILITEGWNRPFVLLLCLFAMIMFVIFVALYSMLTNDGSTGAGIGSFMMAILTLYCTLKYEQWKEQ